MSRGECVGVCRVISAEDWDGDSVVDIRVVIILTGLKNIEYIRT